MDRSILNTLPGTGVQSGYGPFWQAPPPPTAGESQLQFLAAGPKKAVKRRAPQACEACRARKIRCDAATHGLPCTHCKMDGANCVVVESKRKRRKSSLPAFARPPMNPSSLGQASCATSELVLEMPSGGMVPSLAHGEQLQSSLEAIPHWQYSTNGSLPSIPGTTARRGYSDLSVSDSSPDSAGFAALPSYIKPLPARFEQDDITYLRKKGALAIPETSFRNALLHSYSEFVQPFMPLLDVADLTRIIHNAHSSEPISLLLFQAVMFAGAAHVAADRIHAAGYASIREARRAFFGKARLLYDLDYEIDSLTVVQALLLMTYWREDISSRKETHHWIEIALSLVQKLGLNRPCDESPASVQMLRRRLWWSAYLRDCQISSSIGSPTRISQIEFEVPMLKLSDFEFEHAQDEMLPGEAAIGDHSTAKQDLAAMSVEMVRLALCSSHILSVQNATTDAKGSRQTASMLSADLFLGDKIPSLDKLLETWKASLPDSAQYHIPTEEMVENGMGSVIVHRAFLHMTYNSLLSSVHRNALQRSLRGLADTLTASQTAVRVAAANISNIGSSLKELDLLRCLPSPAITTLLPAIVSHLSDLLAPASSLRRSSLDEFYKCMQFMGTLREIYAAADYSTAFLRDAIEQTAIGPRISEVNTVRTDHLNTEESEKHAAPADAFIPPNVNQPSQWIGLRSAVADTSGAQTSPQSDDATGDWQLGSLTLEYGNPISAFTPYMADEILSWSPP